MAIAIYALCAVTAMICAMLLLRGWRRSGHRLLLWSGLCFIGLTLNNTLLVIDARTPMYDLTVWRTLPALIGVAMLVHGLVWESR